MRKLILTAILVTIAALCYSQQMVNGYGLEGMIGRARISDEALHFTFNEKDYYANISGSKCIGFNASFPIDLGAKRHRVTIIPGIGMMMNTYYMKLQGDALVTNGMSYDSLKLELNMYSPRVAVLYRLHFFIGKLHTSFGIGSDFRYALFKTASINDQDDAGLIENSLFNKSEQPIDLASNNAAYNLYKSLQINPRVCLDFYFNNSIMLTFFVSSADIIDVVQSKEINGYVGASLTYIVKSKKITEAQILQQYKK